MIESVQNYDRCGSARTRSRLNVRIAASSLVLLWVLASLLVHLLPHHVPDRAEAPLFSGANIPLSVAGIFGHACIDCHSENTQWPWYSRLAPASWLVESDVKRARKRMNFSRWDSLDTGEKRFLLTAIATVIENREMPPRRYVMLHPGAALSADESVEVIEWTRAERRRLVRLWTHQLRSDPSREYFRGSEVYQMSAYHSMSTSRKIIHRRACKLPGVQARPRE